MKIESNENYRPDGSGLKVAIVVPRFNEKLGMQLAENVVLSLKDHRVEGDDVQMVRCPGAMELPFVVKKIVEKDKVDVVVAIGVVIRGETAHFDYVCNAAVDGLNHLNLAFDVPVINGVLTVNDLEQAEARVDRERLNKGHDFAMAAIEMGKLEV